MWKGIAIGLVVAILPGCLPLRTTTKPPQPTIETPTFSQYHLDTYSWNDVARVVVLPLLNESKYTRAGDEIGTALRAELQTIGRFEIVAAPPDALARLAAGIHRQGRFNEAVMLEIARETRADIVLHGTITQYSPYPRPRLGLVLQAVSPAEGKVVASVDGMWDATRYDIAHRIRNYYRMNPHQHPWIVNNRINEDDSYSDDLALDSPQLFQRFICAEAVLNLVKNGSLVPGPPPDLSKTGECAKNPDPTRSRKNFPPGW